jgi:hypothetical protein
MRRCNGLEAGFLDSGLRIRLAGHCSYVIILARRLRKVEVATFRKFPVEDFLRLESVLGKFGVGGLTENSTEQFFQGQGIPTRFSTQKLC